MGPQGAPEELRFDFGEALDAELAAPAPTRRRRSSLRGDGENAAEVLQRRVDEVIAVAHARESRHHGPAPEPVVTETEVSPLASREPLPDDAPVPSRESDGALTIAGFYERVKASLAQSFPGELWVTGEIRGLREARGHRYLELADEGSEQRGYGRGSAQQLEVVCWSREWPPVAAALEEAGVTLEVGRVVRVRGRVSVWEGGSKLRFTLSAIDIEALLGGIAAARHRLLRALAAEDLLEANRRLPLPLVPLRIGLVTSPGSEAHRDFVGQLKRSGFAFEVRLEPSLVQGAEAPFQLAGAIARLASHEVDLAVVVRGGGARGDLAAFDSEQVARAIATAPFPVWTGIGHTGDRSVADEVAQHACITPTACGEAVVARVGEYVEGVSATCRQLARLACAQLDGADARRSRRASELARGVRHQLERRGDLLVASAARATRASRTLLAGEEVRGRRRAGQLASAVARVLQREEREAHRCQQVLRAYDPRRQLERGWSLTHDASGRLVRSSAAVVAGDVLSTRLADGSLESVVRSSTVAKRAPGASAAKDEGERT